MDYLKFQYQHLLTLIGSHFSNSLPTYPFICDDLIGFLLQLVKAQATDGVRVVQVLGLLIGWCRTSSCRGDVIKV